MLSQFVTNEKVQWRVLFFISSVLIALPFLFATYIPVTDLPQHIAQVKLFFDLPSGASSPTYSVTLFGANLLVYWLLMLQWIIFPPLLAGKISVLLLALSWVAAIFFLAQHKKQSPIVAMLAAVFVFNFTFYWGFLNFIIGFPIFVVWYIVIVDASDTRNDVRRYISILLLSFILFFAHALWLLISVGILFAVAIFKKTMFRKMLMDALSLVPIIVVAGFWYPHLATSRAGIGFDTSAHWFVSPWERFQPAWILDFFLGGLRGPIEWIIFFSIIAWIAASVFTHKRNFFAAVSKDLVVVSIILLLIVFLAPDKFMNTIFFSSRWLPVSMILLIIALPVPKISSTVVFLFSFFLLFILSLTTALTWDRFEKREQTGLTESLNRLPNNAHVLGLDFVRESFFLKGRPFLQTFSYAQVLHGASLNFSFALHNTGIVSIKERDTTDTVTAGLEWFAERIKHEDLSQFDFVLINAHDNLHPVIQSLTQLQPLSNEGSWRLYKCQKEIQKGYVFGFTVQ